MRNKQGTSEIPGETVEFRADAKQDGHSTRNVTSGSLLTAFEKIKHLLSDRPLRRPHRVKPV